MKKETREIHQKTISTKLLLEELWVIFIFFFKLLFSQFLANSYYFYQKFFF